MKTNFTTSGQQQLYLFSNKEEALKVFERYDHNSLFQQMLEMLQQVEHIFKTLPPLVPVVPTEEMVTKNTTYEHIKKSMFKCNNVIHVPFKQLKQLPPLFIVCNETNFEMLRQVKVHIMPVIELCAREQRDVYILSGGSRPIVMKLGIINLQSFEQFMQLQPSEQANWSLEQIVQHSIATPMKHNFQVMLVQFSGKNIVLDTNQQELLMNWKHTFNCNIKGMFGAQSFDSIESSLFDEVYITNIE